MKQIIYLGLSLALSLAVTPEKAFAIDLSTSSSNHNLGDTVNVDLSITLFQGDPPESLSAFDFDINYDNSILDFQSLTFGDRLALSGTNSFQEFSEMMPDTVNLVEVSRNTPEELQMGQQVNGQSLDFTLATLTFNAVGVGTSNIIPSINSLGDANGDPLVIGNINNGLVTVQGSNTSSVPLEFSPGLGVLITASWFGIKYLQRKLA